MKEMDMGAVVQVDTSGMKIVFFLCEYCGGLFEQYHWRSHLKTEHAISEIHAEKVPKIFYLEQA